MTTIFSFFGREIRTEPTDAQITQLSDFQGAHFIFGLARFCVLCGLYSDLWAHARDSHLTLDAHGAV
jgi:hypothetical protein